MKFHNNYQLDSFNHKHIPANLNCFYFNNLYKISVELQLVHQTPNTSKRFMAQLEYKLLFNKLAWLLTSTNFHTPQNISTRFQLILYFDWVWHNICNPRKMIHILCDWLILVFVSAKEKTLRMFQYSRLNNPRLF